MVQVMIKAKNMQVAKRKFLNKYKNKKIYDITRTFSNWKKTPLNKRIYRVTGIKK